MTRQFRFSFSVVPTLVLILLVAGLIGCAGVRGGSGSGTTPAPGGGTPPPLPPPPPPSATLKTSVNHIIMMMQENRSFDHYFGHLNDYRAKQGLPTDVDDLTKVTVKPLPTWCSYSPGSCDAGNSPSSIAPFRMKTGCIEDLSSSWQEAHNDVNLHSPNEGSWGNPPPMNGFAAMSGGFADHTGANDKPGKRSMGYYTGDDLPFYYWAATTFATSDRWFSGAL